MFLSVCTSSSGRPAASTQLRLGSIGAGVTVSLASASSALPAVGAVVVVVCVVFCKEFHIIEKGADLRGQLAIRATSDIQATSDALGACRAQAPSQNLLIPSRTLSGSAPDPQQPASASLSPYMHVFLSVDHTCYYYSIRPERAAPRKSRPPAMRSSEPPVT